MLPPIWEKHTLVLNRWARALAGMETTLHQQLKQTYAESNSRFEVRVGRYRIDVVTASRLIEIQCSGLAAIRDKVRRLLEDGHSLTVVKPVVARKRLIRLSRRAGRELAARWSPLRQTPLNLFDHLLYFTRVFPHPNLRLSIPLIEIEETRYPGHGRRRRWRKNDHVVQDQQLTNIVTIDEYESPADLNSLLPGNLPAPFDTRQLADYLGVARPFAQQIAYCLRHTGAARVVGKRGNARLYRLKRRSANRQTSAA